MMAATATGVQLFLPGPVLLKVAFVLMVAIMTLVANLLWLKPWPAGNTDEGRQAALTLYWVPGALLLLAVIVAANRSVR